MTEITPDLKYSLNAKYSTRYHDAPTFDLCKWPAVNCWANETECSELYQGEEKCTQCYLEEPVSINNICFDGNLSKAQQDL